MVRAYRPNTTRPAQPTQRKSGSYLKRTLWRIVLFYIGFVSLFTCSTSPGHPICRVESFVHNALVAPVHTYIVGTETGARVDAAYKAHLVPFYEKHGAPIISGAQSLVRDTAVPVLQKVAQPATDTLHRFVSPQIEKVDAVYTAYAKPTVDTVKGGICHVAQRFVFPVTVAVYDTTYSGVREYVVPFGRSAVNDYIVPFYTNHVQPRWNHQIKPSVCRYSKVAVEYTRTSILPAIVDGAVYGYDNSRKFASAYIVPHAKKATVYTYVFIKRHVCPPVHSLYAKTLKSHVDRMVPWDKVEIVSESLSSATCATVSIVKGFVEEFYFMCYTIATGEEHPVVVARLRKAAEEARRKDPGFVESIKDRVFAETKESAENGQIQHIARRVSGSARQWVQIARGWIGSAVGNAKDGVASYRNRLEETAAIQFDQATSAAGAATELIAEVANEAASVAGIVEESAKSYIETFTSAAELASETAKVAIETVEVAIETAVDIAADIAAEVTEEVATLISSELSDKPASDVGKEQLSGAVLINTSVNEPVSKLTDSAVFVATSEASKLEDKAEAVLDTVTEAAAEEWDEITSKADYVAFDYIPDIVESSDVISIASDVKESAGPLVDNSQITSATEIVFEVTSKIASVVQDKIIPEAGTSALGEETLVNSANINAETTFESTDINAEDAAAAIYDAREAMAGVVLEKEDISRFEELVKSATEVTGNMEEFPSVLNDIEDNATISTLLSEKPSTSTTAESESQPIEQTIGPEMVVSGSAEASFATNLQFSSPADDIVSETMTASEEFNTDDIPKAIIADQAAVEPASVQMAKDSTIDEDVRKSAFNWVKDARKSISKELAEERTRLGSPTTEISAGSDVAGIVISSAEDPSSSLSDGSALPETRPSSEPEQLILKVPEVDVEQKSDTSVFESTSASIASQQQIANAIPKRDDLPPSASRLETASKTNNAAAKLAASKSEISPPAVPAPAPGELNVDSASLNSEIQTPVKRHKKPATVTSSSSSNTLDTSDMAASPNKGPRKVKKTKRVVKKTAASATAAAALD
ncbi:hypothetical protein GGI25_000029 [Coemansia spiralis]|uniref:Uncharacterized protein n=2 Tax=Coemansia TaxID=4863 RepID=A0A9W8GCQ8_9FUNG|nr:hypothetical protein EDC05_004394 [Coemansia umbellata]KAJ2623093.1 hypothetical protein GGI26_002703 [Coemansia sp. RSA 1358]KAJ2681075.1 hypothetical protein GGI25_000029 [Coemansia spiralis]